MVNKKKILCKIKVLQVNFATLIKGERELQFFKSIKSREIHYQVSKEDIFSLSYNSQNT